MEGWIGQAALQHPYLWPKKRETTPKNSYGSKNSIESYSKNSSDSSVLKNSSDSERVYMTHINYVRTDSLWIGCSEIVTWKLLFNDDHGDDAANNDGYGPGDDGGGNGEFGDGIKGEEQGI